MPTFVFFQYGKEVARLQGASKEPIEQTIKRFYKENPSKDAGYVMTSMFAGNDAHVLSFGFVFVQDRFESIHRREELHGIE
jgi:thioredoxin-like negative regulator of GroEL